MRAVILAIKSLRDDSECVSFMLASWLITAPHLQLTVSLTLVPRSGWLSISS